MTSTATEGPVQHREADRRLELRLALAGVAAVLIAVPFTLLLLLVKANWLPLTDLDSDVADQLNSIANQHGWLVDALDVIAVLSSPWVLRLGVLGVVVWLWFQGLRRLALWAAATAVIGGVLGAVLKLLVERARPSFDQPVANAGGFSFPSGHALNSLLCAGIVLLVFLPVLSHRGRVIAWTAATVLVVLVGFDRVALGVHYVTDVVAGWVVALACLAATAAAFEAWRRGEGRRPSTPDEGVEPEAAPLLSDDEEHNR
jgi:undecaprenyl-diphosphatase